MSSRRLLLVAASGFLALTALLVVGLVLASRTSGDGRSSPDGSAYAGSAPPGGISLPGFALRDERGVLVRSDALRGKVVLLTFLSSPCSDVCPLLGEIVARAVERLTPAEQGRVAALGLSVNPRADTETARRRFVDVHRAQGRLRYLSGPTAELYPLWRELGVLAVVTSGDADVHSAPVRLYDAAGTWVDTLNAKADLTVDSLVHDLRVAIAAG